MYKQGKNNILGQYIRAFKFAFAGIAKVFKSERNFRFHTLAALAAITLGFIFGITTTEWLFVTAAIGLVTTAEALNSAIEKLVDLVSPQKNAQAGWVKDVAAGAVLLASISALVIGLLVFVPYVL